MQSAQLNRMVARATGESVAEIRHRGFSLVDPERTTIDLDPEDRNLPPTLIDWDEFDLRRNVPVTEARRSLGRVAS
ncbi:MAG: hypothetical protein ACF8TS_05235 [Maioricimonas sp. JB049]